jgi:hypothetical protein
MQCVSCLLVLQAAIPAGALNLICPHSRVRALQSSAVLRCVSCLLVASHSAECSSPTHACAAVLSCTTWCQLLAGVLLLLNVPHRHACVLHPSALAAASWVGALHGCLGGSAQKTGRMPAAEKRMAAAAGRAHHTPSLARSASRRQVCGICEWRGPLSQQQWL